MRVVAPPPAIAIASLLIVGVIIGIVAVAVVVAIAVAIVAITVVSVVAIVTVMIAITADAPQRSTSLPCSIHGDGAQTTLTTTIVFVG